MITPSDNNEIKSFNCLKCLKCLKTEEFKKEAVKVCDELNKTIIEWDDNNRRRHVIEIIVHPLSSVGLIESILDVLPGGDAHYFEELLGRIENTEIHNKLELALRFSSFNRCIRNPGEGGCAVS